MPERYLKIMNRASKEKCHFLRDCTVNKDKGEMFVTFMQ